MKTTTKKAIATFLFVFAIGCIVYAINGSIISIIVGSAAAALACSIAENIDKLAKQDEMERANKKIKDYE